jgi:hypothetical protein
MIARVKPRNRHVDLSKLRNSNTFFYPFLGSLSACTWVASVICTWASQTPGETYTEKPKNSTFDNVIHKDSTELGHYILNRYIISNLTKDRTEQPNPTKIMPKLSLPSSFKVIYIYIIVKVSASSRVPQRCNLSVTSQT